MFVCLVDYLWGEVLVDFIPSNYLWRFSNYDRKRHDKLVEKPNQKNTNKTNKQEVENKDNFDPTLIHFLIIYFV